MNSKSYVLQIFVFFCVTLVFAVCGYGYAVFADTTIANSQQEQHESERQILISLLKDLKSDDSSPETLKIQSSSLKNPEFRAVFDWALFKDEDYKSSFSEIKSFYKHNPDFPDANKLLSLAETRIPKNISDEKIIDFFENRSPVTADGMLAYLNALKSSNRLSEEHINNFRRWWQDALISPQMQNSIITKYGNLIDRKSNIARMNRLLVAGHYTNARSIAEQLEDDYVNLCEARISLAEKQSGVDGYINKVPDYLKNDPGLVFERVKWRRRHNNLDGAIELLNSFDYQNTDTSISSISSSSWWRERHIIVRELLDLKRYSDAYKLASNHQNVSGFPFAQAEWISGWIALEMLNEPYKAFPHFETLYKNVNTSISKSRAAYWAGIAAIKAGKQDIGKLWLELASESYGTFYGQLATDTLGININVPKNSQIKITEQEIKDFYGNKFVRTAKILHAAGYDDYAKDFINIMMNHAKTPADYSLLANFAYNSGYIDSSLRVAKNASYNGIEMPEFLYPKMQSKLFDNLPDSLVALVHAIMRQESGFDSKAISRAGAKGLMQLMPATAEEVARSINIKHSTSQLLQDPEHNMLLGFEYLSRMLGKFNGSIIHAVAAYNAGPARIERWAAERNFNLNTDNNIVRSINSIESIPIYETRNYVQRVIEAERVYRKLLSSGS